MSHYENQLVAKDETIKTQRLTIIVMSVFVMSLIVAVIVLPKRITVHIPPDLSDTLRVGMTDVADPNIYTFGFYVFQTLNRWPVDGQEDYKAQINRLKNYMTPACYQAKLDDFDARSRNNELRRRERAVWEVPGRGYSNHRVLRESDTSWRVSLDLHIMETMMGEQVKERVVNYPLRIVRYRVDSVLNPYGLAFDCYAGDPTPIDLQASLTFSMTSKQSS